MAKSSASQGMGRSIYTGSVTEGSPFFGDVSVGIDNDNLDAEMGTYLPVDGKMVPSTQRALTRSLITQMPIGFEDKIVEMGPGTGNSTIEVKNRNNSAYVIGLEKFPGMLKRNSGRKAKSIRMMYFF